MVEHVDVLIVGAVPHELDPLEGWLEERYRRETPWTIVRMGTFGGLRLGLACLGVGKVNAAAGSAVLVERFRPAQIWLVGSAGAYAEGPLMVGDVLVSDTVLLGDEGVWERNGWGSMKALGFPVAEEMGRPVYERFKLTEDAAVQRVAALTPAGLYAVELFASERRWARPVAGDKSTAKGTLTAEDGAAGLRTSTADVFQVAFGPSVTVGMCSGDEWVARQRFARYHAWAEDMEGSAVVQVCRRYGVPVVQCRGISNRAGVRNKRWWRIPDALAHSHAVVGSWLLQMSVSRKEEACDPKPVHGFFHVPQ
ncbi:MAG: phosphorylase family protein [Desulfosoma sp.]|uniref:phosphorylase family protein n=1 Tax=Desulfosoma sp. TaxID=2603217 RepID=UPI004048F376